MKEQERQSDEIKVLSERVTSVIDSVNQAHNHLQSLTSSQDSMQSTLAELEKSAQSLSTRLESRDRESTDVRKDMAIIIDSVKRAQEKAKIAESLTGSLSATVRSNKKQIDRLVARLSSAPTASLTPSPRSTPTPQPPQLVRQSAFVGVAPAKLQGEVINVSGGSDSQSGSVLVLETKLRSFSDRIKKVISKVVTPEMHENLISHLAMTEIPELKKDLAVVYADFARYSDFPSADQALTRIVSESILDAENWITSVKDAYETRKVYSMRNAKDLPIEITPFSPEGTQTIDEFLAEFNSKYRNYGTEDQHADILWRQHLSQRVRKKGRTREGKY